MGTLSQPWFQFLFRVLAAVPAAVAGVEAIAKNASSTEKKTLAMQSLGLASSVASIITPEHQEAVNVATQLAGNAIDSVVAIANATGTFTKSSTPKVAAATAPTTETVSISAAPASTPSDSLQSCSTVAKGKAALSEQ